MYECICRLIHQIHPWYIVYNEAKRFDFCCRVVIKRFWITDFTRKNFHGSLIGLADVFNPKFHTKKQSLKKKKSRSKKWDMEYLWEFLNRFVRKDGWCSVVVIKTSFGKTFSIIHVSYKTRNGNILDFLNWSANEIIDWYFLDSIVPYKWSKKRRIDCCP